MNLILLVFVIVIIWRLNAVLGTGGGTNNKNNDTYGFGLDDRDKNRNKNSDSTGQQTEGGPSRPPLRVVANGETPKTADELTKIRGLDPSFDARLFIENASTAYEIILRCFSEHDRKTLKPLVSAEVYQGFDQVMKAREQEGYSLRTEIISVDRAEIADVELEGSLARITINFEVSLASA
ncbi:MAG: Tim44/TimA family putative adaptor protein, partial [Pseudomonadota bacterium]|nr:Tim44/TimA family putative adaptor protein [Pseudomonadota bacterium]